MLFYRETISIALQTHDEKHTAQPHGRVKVLAFLLLVSHRVLTSFQSPTRCGDILDNVFRFTRLSPKNVHKSFRRLLLLITKRHSLTSFGSEREDKNSGKKFGFFFYWSLSVTKDPWRIRTKIRTQNFTSINRFY